MLKSTLKKVIVSAALASTVGTGNIVGAESPFKNRARANYRLSAASRDAINRGDNAVWTGTALREALDLDGNPRLKDGVIDLGCFEYANVPTMLLVQ